MNAAARVTGEGPGDVCAALAALPTSERHAFAKDVARRAAALGLVYVDGDVLRPIAVALPASSLAPAPASSLASAPASSLASASLASSASSAASAAAPASSLASASLASSASSAAAPASSLASASLASPAALQTRGRIARVVLDALVDVAAVVLSGERAADAPLRAALLADLAPLEREIVLAGAYRPRLATARADLLVDVDGHPWLLEMNATIPAMQGYSDIAARAFVDAARARFPHLPAPAPASSNSDDLLDALVARYRDDGGAAARPAIGLVHRRGDSQREELRFLAARWRARGHRADLVVVDDVAAAAGIDLWYRHIFARRLDADGAFARLLRAPQTHHVYNPVAAPLEQKALLAALSERADDDDDGVLDDEARDVVRRSVPWTRRLLDTTTTTLSRAREPLVPWVKAHRGAVVVKRSSDYGGKSVVLGDDFAGDWDAFVDDCARDGGWVVQQRVRLQRQRLTLATPDAASDGDFYVDACAWAAGGAVSRVSASPIVNIQRGGGVLVLLDER